MEDLPLSDVFCVIRTEKKETVSVSFLSKKIMQKMGLEPTRYCYHRHLKPARLPIPPFLHIKLLCCPAADKAYNTTTTFKCQHFFSVFSNAYFLYFFRKTVDIMPYFWYHFFLSETIMTTHAEVSELADEQD